MQSREQEQGQKIYRLLEGGTLKVLQVQGDGNCLATSLIGGILDSLLQRHITHESSLIQDLISEGIINHDFTIIDPVKIRDTCAHFLYRNGGFNGKFGKISNKEDVDDIQGYPFNGPKPQFRNAVSSADIFLKIFTHLFSVNVILYTNDGKRSPFATIYWSSHQFAGEAKMIFIEHVYDQRGIPNHFNPLVYDKEKIYHLMKPFLDGKETHEDFIAGYTQSDIEGQRKLFAHYDSKKESAHKQDPAWIRIKGLSSEVQKQDDGLLKKSSQKLVEQRINELNEELQKYTKVSQQKMNELTFLINEGRELQRAIIPSLDNPCASKLSKEGNMPLTESINSERTNNYFNAVIKRMELDSEALSVEFRIKLNAMERERAQLRNIK